MVEFGIERDHLATDALQRLRREGARRAVAAGGDDTQFPRDLLPRCDIVEIGLAEICDELVGAAADKVEVAAKNDPLQRQHFFRPESQGTLCAHLHAGPAVFVMRGRHHRN